MVLQGRPPAIERTHMPVLTAPITYQGGKQRIAHLILDHIRPDPGRHFYDLCCGSGAVSVELVNRGYPPEDITMLDKGPWGLFWRMVGDGTFDADAFASRCAALPKDRAEIKPYMEALCKHPVAGDAAYVFLLLQASSFGGKAIWTEGSKWMNCSFRSYWLPTATSSRRSPVNPMMPLPETLAERVSAVCSRMRGVHGVCGDITGFSPGEGVVYIDPPYAGTTHYGYTFDVGDYVSGLRNKCYVSEGRKLSEKTCFVAAGRSKGGISGDRKVAPHEEWLSEFN